MAWLRTRGVSVALWLDPDPAGEKGLLEIGKALEAWDIPWTAIDTYSVRLPYKVKPGVEPGDLEPGHPLIREVLAYLDGGSWVRRWRLH